MNTAIDLREILQSIDLADGGRIVLLDRLGKRDKYSEVVGDRNIFRLDNGGGVIWQVRSDHDNDQSGPFVSVIYKNGRLTAVRWIGLLYEINLETGFGVVIAETR
jgi:hypothetical protein